MPNELGTQPVEGAVPHDYLDIDYLSGLTLAPSTEPEDMVASWMRIHQSFALKTQARADADAALAQRLIDVYGLGVSAGELSERDRERVERRLRLLGCLAIENADPVDAARAKEVGYDFFHLVTKDARDRVHKREAQVAWEEAEAAREHAHEMATHDSLTGLRNRRGLYEALDDMLTRVSAGEYDGLLVVFMDVDEFKAINDTLGHSTGDGTLQGIAGVLTKNTRAPSHDGTEVDIVFRPRRHGEPEAGLADSDAPEAESGRLGGDEFLSLIPLYRRGTRAHPSRCEEGQKTQEEDAAEISARLAGAATDFLIRFTGGDIPGVGISAGYVLWDGEMSADELIAAADKRMYAAKAQRKLANGQTNGRKSEK